MDDEYAIRFKEGYNLIDYIKISSKTGENINEAFEQLLRKILKLESIILI